MVLIPFCKLLLVREGWLPQGIQEQCEVQNCLQIIKGEQKPFQTNLGTSMRALKPPSWAT
jgi:hypothetical protein